MQWKPKQVTAKKSDKHTADGSWKKKMSIAFSASKAQATLDYLYTSKDLYVLYTCVI